MNRRARLTGLMVLLLLATPACHHTKNRIERYNEWKKRCYELSTFYKEKLKTPPYHSMSNLGADKCSTFDDAYRWDPNKDNMHILVANFLYHSNLDTRRMAFDMLESYRCERDHTCDELARLLDAHISASLPQQSEAWKQEFHSRARDYYRHVLEREK